MNILNLSKSEVEIRLIRLFDEVQLKMKEYSDIDAFLDDTDLFDEWEAIIPDDEFPILIMAVLNNFKKDSIIEVLSKSIVGESTNIQVEKVKNINRNIDFDLSHPFS